MGPGGPGDTLGALTVLSSAPTFPAALAVYSGNVYFTDLASENNDGSVWELGTTDGSQISHAE
ncbi:MAG TPA: hypothetical protein VIK01_21615 [Polyangiaceae bacterium]